METTRKTPDIQTFRGSSVLSRNYLTIQLKKKRFNLTTPSCDVKEKPHPPGRHQSPDPAALPFDLVRENTRSCLENR